MAIKLKLKERLFGLSLDRFLEICKEESVNNIDAEIKGTLESDLVCEGYWPEGKLILTASPGDYKKPLKTQITLGLLHPDNRSFMEKCYPDAVSTRGAQWLNCFSEYKLDAQQHLQMLENKGFTLNVIENDKIIEVIREVFGGTTEEGYN